MTKTAWVSHMEKASGLKSPSHGGDIQMWKQIVSDHLKFECPDCKARQATRLKNARKSAREDAYRSCGLTKVRGSVSGKIYWE